MPACAATARTVSPPGPSRTSTASAAETSSRSTSALGVRGRRAAVPCSGLMRIIISRSGVDIYRTSLHSYSTTFYKEVPMITNIASRPPSDRRRWWILAVLCLSVLLTVVDNTIVNVALPTMSRDLHASTEALQWVVDGYTLAFAGLLLVGG